MTSLGDFREKIIINDKQYLGIVNRDHRFVLIYGCLPVTATDTIVVPEMYGTIIDVQHDANCTLIKLG